MMLQIRHTKSNKKNVLKIFVTILMILTPILIIAFYGGARSAVVDFFSFFIKGGNYMYKGENESEMEKNRMILLDYNLLKFENQKLRELIGLKPEGAFIVANVLAKPPQIPLGSMFLDRGAIDGVKEGDLVLASDKIVLGKITKITKNKSVVSLSSSAQKVSYGFVARTGEPIEIKGSGGCAIEARTSIDFDIVVGDQIMANGSPSFLIAVVSSIEEDKPAGFKKILMSLPANISRINMVFIKSYSDD